MKKTAGIRLLFWLLVLFASWQSALVGNEIYFVSDMDEPGNMDIYVIDADTLVVRRLTTHPAIDNHPDLAPDNSSRVVWSSNRNPGSNPEEDFELFIAVDDGTTGGLENGTVLQITSNDYADRHPHFNHDTVNPIIIYTAKYYCVSVIEQICTSECSITICLEVTHPCGRKCEGMRIIKPDGSGMIDIDHDMLTAANPIIWPIRPLTAARWVGHPDFSEDGSQIVFSGAVDGEGRNWEVYVADWNGSIVTDLRQVTDGSLYPDNPNPIKMNAGAKFSHDGVTILYSSTLTEYGNSQLFEIPAASVMVPTAPANRFTTTDRANDYVPHYLHDGRVVITSDRDDFRGPMSCFPPSEYFTLLDPGSTHTIRVEAGGEKESSSGGFRIHLDTYRLDTTLVEQDVGTTYSGVWTTDSSPNASTGYYEVAGDGTSGEYVDIDVPIGTSEVRLQLGRTPISGVARIYIDGVPIENGDFELTGDPAGKPSGLTLYTPFRSPGNDLDLIVISADGLTQTNITDDDLSDEMLLIGDEVSWFCGLSPNVTPCTYLPKTFTIGRLRLMMEEGGFTLPNYYPNRFLYPIAYQALEEFMVSGGNGLRPHNLSYWQNVMAWMNDPGQLFDDKFVVLPTPVIFGIQNQAPTMPGNPNPPDGASVPAGSIPLHAMPSTDPDGHPITYDIYLAEGSGPFLNVDADIFNPQTMVENLGGNNYRWRVVAKDAMGGLTYGPEWGFTAGPPSLLAFSYELSTGGGMVDFFMDAGPSHGNRGYILLGSVTGTMPGTPLPGGGLLPLNQDPFTNWIMNNVGSPVINGFFGNLDINGQASATFNSFGPLPPVLPPGMILNFAFTTLWPMDFQSNPVAVQIVPGSRVYEWDDGSTENLLAWTAGGEICWFSRFSAFAGGETIMDVQCIFGSAMYPGYAPGNGTVTECYVWNDPNNDGDPTDAVLVSQESIVVANVDTDTYNVFALTFPAMISGEFFVGCNMPHGPSQFCAPIDQTTPYVAGDSFYCGDYTGLPFDPTNLMNNSAPPAEWGNYFCIRAGY
jgi:hypothetical protein